MVAHDGGDRPLVWTASHAHVEAGARVNYLPAPTCNRCGRPLIRLGTLGSLSVLGCLAGHLFSLPDRTAVRKGKGGAS